MKWHWDHVEWHWWESPTFKTGEYLYWFWWCNWLRYRESRFIGLSRDWYDGPIVSFGFWWFSMVWRTRNSWAPLDFCTEEAKARWMNRPWIVRWFFGMQSYEEMTG